MSTGSGKTLTILEVIARLRLTATVLVNKVDHINQFAEEAQKAFQYEIGRVGDGVVDIRGITVATVQTLQRDEEVAKQLATRTSVLIVDECQSMVTDKSLSVIETFNPSHLYGFTATPMRSEDDGKTPVIEFYFGRRIVNFSLKQLIPTVHVYRTSQAGVNIPVSAEYNDMIESMVYNDNRNTFIQKLAVIEAYAGRKVLILTKRIEHAKLLYLSMPNDLKGVHYIHRDDKDRSEKLSLLKKNMLNFTMIIGTTSLLAVGTDIPALDTLLLACDMKGEVLTIQSAGRILRLFDGKEDPQIIDLYDDGNPIFKKQFWARHDVYEAKEWKISGVMKKKQMTNQFS